MLSSFLLYISIALSLLLSCYLITSLASAMAFSSSVNAVFCYSRTVLWFFMASNSAYIFELSSRQKPFDYSRFLVSLFKQEILFSIWFVLTKRSLISAEALQFAALVSWILSVRSWFSLIAALFNSTIV